MSASIQLELRESLSRRACAVILSNLIKFIAYNNSQIPYTYEVFQSLVCLKRNGNKQKKGDNIGSMTMPPSFKQIRANAFYDKIEQTYNAFERTFKCIEDELTAGNIVKELAIILGATLVSPKHVYRILIPELTNTEECDKKIRSNLISIYRSIVGNGTTLSGRCSELTNIFILINGLCTHTVDNGWFVPKCDFTLPKTAAQTIISFNNSKITEPTDCEHLNTGVHSTPSLSKNRVTCNGIMPKGELPSANNWYLAKQTLHGFQDLKIDGLSVLTF